MSRTAAPAKLRLLNGRGEGKDSGGRPVETGPTFRRIPPTPPDDLVGEALDEWNRVVPELVRLDLLKEGDRATLVTYCEAWAVFCEATDQIRVHGLFIEAKQGLIPHPAVAIQRNAAKEVRAIAAHFGLTPSTEQALARGDGRGNDDENPFD